MIDLANEAKTPWSEMSAEARALIVLAQARCLRVERFDMQSERWHNIPTMDLDGIPYAIYRVYPEDVEKAQNADLRIDVKPNIPEYQTADLRDQFAMAALTGMITAPEWHSDIAGLAREAYLIADAMIKARGADNE